MTNHDELRLREDLETLARSKRGRQLLQLGLRGLERGERGVAAGCWVRRGDAGCLFMHAYWEGVREGIFADKGRPGDWIGSFVGPHDYGLVIKTIASFDQLAKSTYSEVEPRSLLPSSTRLRQGEWNAAVERLLMEVLDRARGEEPAEQFEEATTV